MVESAFNPNAVFTSVVFALFATVLATVLAKLASSLDAVANYVSVIKAIGAASTIVLTRALTETRFASNEFTACLSKKDMYYICLYKKYAL